MMAANKQGRFLIIITVAAALMLSIFKMPLVAKEVAPHWLALVVIFWTVNYPDRFGMGAAWFCGLMLDLVRVPPVGGQYALAMVVLAFFTLRFHQRIRIYPFLQQEVAVISLLFVFQLAILMVQWLTDTLFGFGWLYWAGIVTSALVWPIAYFILSGLSYRFRVAT